MKDNAELKERLYAFALRVVRFARSLPRDWYTLEIGRQLLRSGTSVDANYEEACGAFSRQEFIYRMSISFREAKESNYWLRLLKDSGIVNGREIDYLIQESGEVRNILGTAVKTARKTKS